MVSLGCLFQRFLNFFVCRQFKTAKNPRTPYVSECAKVDRNPCQMCNICGPPMLFLRTPESDLVVKTLNFVKNSRMYSFGRNNKLIQSIVKLSKARSQRKWKRLLQRRDGKKENIKKLTFVKVSKLVWEIKKAYYFDFKRRPSCHDLTCLYFKKCFS